MDPLSNLNFSLSEFEQAGLYSAEGSVDEALNGSTAQQEADGRDDQTLIALKPTEPDRYLARPPRDPNIVWQAQQALQATGSGEQFLQPFTPDGQQQQHSGQVSDSGTDASKKQRNNREYQRTFRVRRKVLPLLKFSLCRLQCCIAAMQ